MIDLTTLDRRSRHALAREIERHTVTLDEATLTAQIAAGETLIATVGTCSGSRDDIQVFDLRRVRTYRGRVQGQDGHNQWAALRGVVSAATLTAVVDQ